MTRPAPMKPHRTLIALLLALCVALGFSAPASAREWLRAALPGMVIYSDGGEHDLKLWTLKLELFDALLKQRYGNGSEDQGSPLTIYLLENENAVSKQAGRRNLTGFYSSSAEGSFAVASRQPEYYKERLSGQMSLFHEYTHHFMYRHFVSAYPAWYREGFAEYTSTTKFDLDWRPTLAIPAFHRYSQLRKSPPSLEKILTASVEDFKPDEKARFYAWSWKLVTMLNADGARKQQLDRYLKLYAEGADPLTAAAATFGDLKQLEGELRGYVAFDSGISLPDPVLPKHDLVAVEKLDPVASQLVDLHLARRLNAAPAQTSAALQALAEIYPERTDVLLELALARKAQGLAGDANALRMAEAAAAKAMTLAPDNARITAVWADLAIRRMKGDASTSAKDWDAMRRRLAIATARDSDDPYALMTFFRTYVEQRKLPSPAAHDAIAQALTLQPESYHIRMLRAFSLAVQKRFDEAKAIARILASDPHASEMGKRALASLERAEAQSQSPSLPQVESEP